ncbi:SDR family NAD(P)-dependent oxidoreductase [Selenihalanaerobacter shriftii]|uniref:NAD(P)-dependent dehydrogenase, short-chain alcohol dehydrogenase family n=1 Tax=Selenihalanaerobacter shriftii TaxID=142842 RepID=A0A1T4L577_9FIRM|nr:SDR family NAD(P)-dependent oxidoreductase [Selenihalanaerobacter shriftii]SJZ49763.1 NAD(P)-dependent dehydrogenase, short-chain alcohol dehydrogenase family [Selenihalanaerobacter shriftii]
MLLKEKVAIITGAASGFGKETSKLFADEGAKVIGVDYNEEGQEVIDEINDNGGEAVFVQGDVSKAEDVKKFVDEAINTYGRIDILFNNAGIYIPGKVDEIDIDNWKRVLDVNLDGVFLGCKYAVTHMKENSDGGVIINTGSAAGLMGFPDAVSYAASKGAVVSLTKALAVDHADDNIRVNCICPGTGETEMTREVLEDEQLREMFLQPIPLNEFGQPDDIANAALFLASDLSSYITGVALPVDGGWTMS